MDEERENRVRTTGRSEFLSNYQYTFFSCRASSSSKKRQGVPPTSAAGGLPGGTEVAGVACTLRAGLPKDKNFVWFYTVVEKAAESAR